MILDRILPRSLGESDSDCASIFTSLVMAAHFERTRARALGWRGIRPAASEHPAWTCRIAGSDHIFGIRFDGEKRTQFSADEKSEYLQGWFSLFVFPPSESPLLDRFPLNALHFGLSPMYEDSIREFSGTEYFFEPFILGQLRFDVSCAGDALAITLEAPARHRVISLDGVEVENGWLVKPGEAECDIPSFSLLLRLFSVLTATAEQQLDEKAELWRGMHHVPRMCFRSFGGLEEYEKEKEAMLTITASFGPSPAMTNERLATLHSLPLRHKPEELEQLSRPVLHVLTGFLGAGKTTFLRRWLDFLHGRERYTGVIQNEFGKVELDAALMKGDTIVEALDEGCVCCSIADSLRPGIERIIATMPAEQFVLETTGLANPANIMEALGGLADIVTPGLVITVADALDLCREARKDGTGEDTGQEISGIRHAQILKADVIILNKSDMVSSSALEELSGRIHALNTKALVLPAQYGNIAFGELDAWIDAHAEARLPSHRPQLMSMGQTEAAHSTHESEGYTARTVTFEKAVSCADLEKFLQDAGPGLCRAKGIIEIEGEGVCIVQYAAGQLEITQAPDEKTLDLVLIGTELHI